MSWKEQDSINKIPPDGTMWPGKYIHPKGWMTYATIWKCFGLSRFAWVSFLLDEFQLFLLFSCFYRKETINTPICAQFLILYPWVSWELVNLFPLIYIVYLHLRSHGCSTIYRYWNVASLGILFFLLNLTLNFARMFSLPLIIWSWVPYSSTYVWEIFFKITWFGLFRQ